jgi:hypothetical protein
MGPGEDLVTLARDAAIDALAMANADSIAAAAVNAQQLAQSKPWSFTLDTLPLSTQLNAAG